MVMMDSKLTMVKETWSSGILLPLIALLLILATLAIFIGMYLNNDKKIVTKR